MQQQELLNSNGNLEKPCDQWSTDSPRSYSSFSVPSDRYSTPNGDHNGSTKYNGTEINGHADSNGVKTANLPDILLNGLCLN